MRIPRDIPLAEYIRQLIRENQIELFYKSDDWLELRDDVLRADHYECLHCMQRGEVVRADCVHHVNHVRKRPDLALSRIYLDKDGNEQRNLLPLCNACHNVEHPEKFGNYQKRDKFTNEERW